MNHRRRAQYGELDGGQTTAAIGVVKQGAIAWVVEDFADSARTPTEWLATEFRGGSNFSEVGASANPGAVQILVASIAAE
jgi:hypothetical protein